MKQSSWWTTLSLPAVLLYSAESSAWNDGSPTLQELRMLPPYCQAQMHTDSQHVMQKSEQQKRNEHRRWQSILGDGYGHVHHYCWALNFINRYYRDFSAKDREGYLSAAIKNFDYTITRVPNTFPLLPEMLTARGKTFAMMNRPGEAFKDLQRALQIKPKYEKAYVILADLYEKAGQQDAAKEVLQLGLRYVPNSKMLLKRSKAIGTTSKQLKDGKHP
jgi:tetratricopeptide (TPR) repeat protein